ncbi:MAG: lipopolysaccharide biosynthesis protein [Azonexus sp.]|nr:lipopolysaccharide biosynthesis protein [Azonexus sp.]
MSIKIKVLTGLKWTAAGRIASQAINWTITIYVMRLVAPEDYGLMALAVVFSVIFSVLSEIGLGSALVQSKDISGSRIQQVFGIGILSNTVVFGIMFFLVAQLASDFFNDPRLQLVIQVISIQFLPAAFAIVPSALMTRNMAFRERSIVEFLSNLGAALVTFLLAWLGYGVFALAWGFVTGSAIRATGLIALSPPIGWPKFNFKGCSEILRFGSNVAGMQFIWTLYSQADALIVGKILGKYSLGVYSVSMDLAALPGNRISAILNQVTFPAFSHLHREGKEIGPFLQKGFRYLSIVSFPIMWGMSSVSQEIVNVLLGEKWIDAIIPLTVLCLIMPFRILLPLIDSGLHAVGRADKSFHNICIIATIMTITFVVGCQYGLIGLVLGWLIIYPIIFLIIMKKSCVFFGLTLTGGLSSVVRPAIIGAVMYGSVFIMRDEILFSPVLNMAILIAIGAFVYLILSFMFNRKALVEIFALLKGK